MAAATIQENKRLTDPSIEKEEISNSGPNSLTFVRLKIPTLIPKNLIENVKGKTFSVEQFYDYQKANVRNPHNHLYAMIDEKNKIHGYLWAETNVLDGSLLVHTFSITKDFWAKGEVISNVRPFLKQLKEKTKATHVFWITTNEKFFLKKGFKRSKNVLMEYNSD